MATVGQIYHRVIDSNSGQLISTSGVDIYRDIIEQQGAVRFTKLGIQAPPGTRVVMNNSKTIMVGRTGMYELDDDIVITALYFVRPRKYTLDTDASENAKKDGIDGMQKADAYREQELNRIASYTGDDYWNAYNKMQATYIEMYTNAFNLYSTGNNGIYKLEEPSDPNHTDNWHDLDNVIVDFIYE